LHKIRRWKIDLNAAKGKVDECEKMLSDLEKEVEEVDRNLEIIDSGLLDLEQRILQATNDEESSVGDSAGVVTMLH
jgi:predicted  nucleic acid-binding Zn-ribbon protein